MQPAVERESCVFARRTLSLALDGEAAAPALLAATVHLGGCERCRQFALRAAAITRELRGAGTRAGLRISNRGGGTS